MFDKVAEPISFFPTKSLIPTWQGQNSVFAFALHPEPPGRNSDQ
jgi:hypothetical protein